MVLLTICIPTYNRAEYLTQTIESIVSQVEFLESNEVEIVVSDNCSSDSTQKVLNSFIKKFHSKIKYNKNQVNLSFDRNYELALEMGSGVFLKLNNDTLIHKKDSLSIMLKALKNCQRDNTFPFFMNGESQSSIGPTTCNNVPQFISIVSYWSTWIGSFAIRKTDFESLPYFSNNDNLLLSQVDVLFRLINCGKKITIIPEKLYTVTQPNKKGGYNIFEIFLTKYFSLLSPYYSKSTKYLLKKEKHNVLWKLILPVYLSQNNSDQYRFHIDEYNKTLIKEFGRLVFIKFEIIYLFNRVNMAYKSK